MRRELRSGLVTASLLSSVLAAVAVIWSFTDKDNASILSTWAAWSENSKPVSQLCHRDPEHPFVFGGVIFLGTWVSMMVSTVNGAGTPIVVGSAFETLNLISAIYILIQCLGEYVKIRPSQDCWSPWDCLSRYCWSVLSPWGQLCNI